MRRKKSRTPARREARPLQQLTLRGFEPALEKAIRRLASDERISLNQAALKLLRKGAGLAPTGKIGNSLDHLIGTWTEEEFKQFQEAQKFMDIIDESMWK